MVRHSKVSVTFGYTCSIVSFNSSGEITRIQYVRLHTHTQIYRAYTKEWCGVFMCGYLKSTPVLKPHHSFVYALYYTGKTEHRIDCIPIIFLIIQFPHFSHGHANHTLRNPVMIHQSHFTHEQNHIIYLSTWIPC